MTDDDDDRLRGLLVPSGDLDAARIAAIHDRAHAAMRGRPAVRTIVRAVEPVVIALVAIAELAWAWSVVLR